MRKIKEWFLIYTESEGATFQVIMPNTKAELEIFVESINKNGWFKYHSWVANEDIIVPVHIYFVVSGYRHFPDCGPFAKYNDQRPNFKKGN